jgi:CRP-like cAMP-binding protein
MNDYTNVLNRSMLFKDISDDEKADILGCLTYQIKEFRQGHVIALEGNEIRYFGLILEGSIDMIKEDVWGNRTLITRMSEGELFGETFACGIEQQSVVTFTAVGNVTVMMLPFMQVIHTCSNSCSFHEKLIRNLVHTIAMKNKSLMQKVEIITKKNLREKILAYLSIQAQMQNTRYFQIPLKRGELAQYLCADRSALTRELTQMREEHIIDFDRNTFRIY